MRAVRMRAQALSVTVMCLLGIGALLSGSALGPWAAAGVLGVCGVCWPLHLRRRRAAEAEAARCRSLLQALIDAVPHALYVKNLEQRLVLANRASAELTGMARERMIGKSLAELSTVVVLRPEDIARIPVTDAEVLSSGRPVEFEIERLETGGERRRFRVIKAPLADVSGAVTSILLLAEDVTARARAEQELRAQREQLQAILDAVAQDLVVKDLSGRVILVNQRVLWRWNRPREELLGVRGHSLEPLTAADQERIEESDRQVLQEGRELVSVTRVRDVSGEVKTFRIHKVPLRDAAGAITGLVMTAEDISELAALQRDLAESHHLLRTVLDAIPETVTLKDPAGRYQVVNAEMLARAGWSASGAIGRGTADLPLITPQGKEDIHRADAEVVTTGRPIVLPQVEWQLPGGGSRWERVLKQPLRGPEGEITGIVTIGEDITDLVEARQEAERARRTLEAFLDALPAGVFAKDLHGRFILANAPFAAIYGLAPGALLGRTSRDLPHITPEQIAAFIEEDRRVMENGETVDSGVIAGPRLPGQPERWFHVAKVPLRDAGGAIFGLAGLAEDVTAQRKTEEERLALSRLMQRTQNLESLGIMAGGIAHEFNNFLQRILGHTELALAAMPADHAVRRDLEQVQQAGRSAVTLTNQMVALSGRSRFRVERLHLNRALEAMLPEIRGLLPGGVTLSHDLDGPSQTVLADEPLLRQVVTSLVINAAEAMAGGGGRVHLEVGRVALEHGAPLDYAYSDRTLRAGQYAYLEVRDDGPGIPAEILERLYEPFFSSKFIGRGLGLAAVRGIVHGHQGALHVASIPGKGTAFRVLLPLAGE
jgi:PAS domain S-box-containing protein